MTWEEVRIDAERVCSISETLEITNHQARHTRERLAQFVKGERRYATMEQAIEEVRRLRFEIDKSPFKSTGYNGSREVRNLKKEVLGKLSRLETKDRAR